MHTKTDLWGVFLILHLVISGVPLGLNLLNNANGVITT